MTTSLILTGKEWDYALYGGGEPGQLCEKGLASRGENEEVVIGPELKLIVEEYISAAAGEVSGGVTAIRGKRFCMLIEPYPHIEGTLKIMLLKDAAALEEAISERA